MPTLCKYSLMLKREHVLPFERNFCSNCSEIVHIYIFIEHLFINNIKQEIVYTFLGHQNSKIRHISFKYLMKFYSSDNYKLEFDPYYKNRLLVVKKLDVDVLIHYLDDYNDEILLCVLKELYARYCTNKDIFEKNLFKDNICISKENYENSKILISLSRLIYHQNSKIRILVSKLLFTFVNNEELLDVLDKKIEKEIGGMVVLGLEDECAVVRKNTIISLYLVYKYFFTADKFENEGQYLEKLSFGSCQNKSAEKISNIKAKRKRSLETTNNKLKNSKKIKKLQKKYLQLKKSFQKNKIDRMKNIKLLRKAKNDIINLKKNSLKKDKILANLEKCKNDDLNMLKQKNILDGEMKDILKIINLEKNDNNLKNQNGKYTEDLLFQKNFSRNRKKQFKKQKNLSTEVHLKSIALKNIDKNPLSHIIKSKIIEYFINTINDENEDVRQTAIYLFFLITKSQKFKLCDDYIKQICYNLVDENKNDLLDLYSINILCNIKYKSAEMLKFAIKKISFKLNTKDLVKLAYEIFVKNIDLVFTNLYKRSSFNKQERELFDKEYIIEILINYILFEKKLIQMKASFSKYFTLIDVLLERTKKTDEKFEKKNEKILKKNLRNFLHGKPFINVFTLKYDVPEYYLFIKDLYKALVKNSKSKILEIKKIYRNVEINENILNDKKKLFDFLNNLKLINVKLK